MPYKIGEKITYINFIYYRKEERYSEHSNGFSNSKLSSIPKNKLTEEKKVNIHLILTFFV